MHGFIFFNTSRLHILYCLGDRLKSKGVHLIDICAAGILKKKCFLSFEKNVVKYN